MSDYSIEIVKNIDSYFYCKEPGLQYVKNKYWSPIHKIINIVENFCKINNYKNILEIGPGTVPFSLATKFIGYNEKIKSYVSVDIDEDKIPFENKELEFIYCRHTIEDIQNPTFALREIFRTTRSGYIETPSPLVEIIRGIDAQANSNTYGGYIHHRYIVWSDIKENTIYILPKYSCIIDNNFIFEQSDIIKYLNLINNYPVYWNNYFIWQDKTPKIVMYKNGVNFGGRTIVQDYIEILKTAVRKSIENTNYFIKNYSNIL